VVYKASSLGISVFGIRYGWAGLLNGEADLLTLEEVADISGLGGTIIGTSRTNPYKIEDGNKKVLDNFNRLGLDALIAAGGEDTLGVANKLFQEGLKVVGVPKTIDNDLSCTDCTFGFDTAVSIACEAIDRLHTTAKSHKRAMVVEIMGRHAGWITLMAGMAAGAHYIIIPEVPFDIEDVCRVVKERAEKGKLYTIIAVSEGARFDTGKGRADHILQSQELDEFGHVRLGGIAKALEKIIEKETKVETRSVVLGHLQRGGSPTAFDRNLGTRLGIKAVEMVVEGKFGYLASLYENKIQEVPLSEAVGRLKTVDKELYEVAKTFFG
jgi:6-phosphofructokinase 1